MRFRTARAALAVPVAAAFAASYAAGQAPADAEALLRRIVADVAVTQLDAPAPAWHPDQRDCAGLVRFTYRAAFLKVRPGRVAQGLWLDGRGRPSAFADAATLLSGSFALLGRDAEARARLRSGDLVAFAQPGDPEPTYHLMLVVRPQDPAHTDTVVLYHPGEKGAPVRMGSLVELSRIAPREWRPEPDNRAFLGFYRFKEWTR